MRQKILSLFLLTVILLSSSIMALDVVTTTPSALSKNVDSVTFKITNNEAVSKIIMVLGKGSCRANDKASNNQSQKTLS